MQRMGTTTVLLPLLMLLSFSRHVIVAGEECGTRFTDFSSSVVLAEVVLQGSVMEFLPTPFSRNIRNAHVNVSNVFKGMEVLKTTGRINDEQMVVVQSFGQENRDDCVAPEDDKFKHQDMVFFLRQSPDIRMMKHSALPLPAEGNEEQRVSRSMCDTCIQPPSIRRLVCKDCASEPTIRPMKSKKATMGRRARLRCLVRGKPTPTISWFKNDVPIMSGNGGLTIRTTGLTSILQFSRTTSAHSGRYKCVASNGIGNTEEFVTLEVSRKTRRKSVKTETLSVKDAPDRVECQANPCFNGGTCFFSASLNLRQCVCSSGFEGVRCENIHSLKSLRNDTIIEHSRPTTARKIEGPPATKPPRHEMKLCENSNLCFNGGTCRYNLSLDVTFCLCPTGFFGPRCESLPSAALNVTNTIRHFTTPSSTSQSTRLTEIDRATVRSVAGPSSTSTVSTRETTDLTSTSERTVPSIAGGTFSGNNPKISNTDVFTTRTSQINPRPIYPHRSNGQRLPSYPVKKKSSLKIISCRDKHYCENKGKCKFISKLNKKFCQCRKGYGGLRCERKLF